MPFESAPKESQFKFDLSKPNKKEKEGDATDKEKEEEISKDNEDKNKEDECWKKNQNFHPYSPESHNVIRCGKSLSPRPNLDPSIYKDHQEKHVQAIFEVPAIYTPYISIVLGSTDKSSYRKAIRDIPCCNGEEESGHDFLESIFRAVYNFQTTAIKVDDRESTFNSLFIYPFLEAIAVYLKETEDWCRAGFCHGEAPLQAMNQQLKTLPVYDEETHLYLADSTIKLFAMKEVEVLLLETSGPFGNKEKPKLAFDHHKGLFGALAMLKTIADYFPQAKIDTFSCLKVFFIQGAGEQLYLWSMRFEPSIEEKISSLSGFLRFFWGLKCLLRESVLVLRRLKNEHAESLVGSICSNSKPTTTLSNIVDPTILRPIEEDDKPGMHLLGPFYE